MKYGVWLYPIAPARDLVAAVADLDAAGVDEVWIADEGVAREPFAVLSAAAERTRTIDLGIGITSPILRHPGAVAATTSTIDELSDGRAILGWGVGGHESLGPFGLATDRPVGVVRDALGIARSVFDRTPSDVYDPPPHAAPARRVRQYVGARGEQLNRLASREADGVFLSGLTHDRLATTIGWARSERPIDVALYQSVRYSSTADDTSMSGTPPRLAAELAELVATHRPTSIGLALVEDDDLAVMIARAISTIDELRTL